jgi:hypothetical protein
MLSSMKIGYLSSSSSIIHNQAGIHYMVVLLDFKVCSLDVVLSANFSTTHHCSLLFYKKYELGMLATLGMSMSILK